MFINRIFSSLLSGTLNKKPRYIDSHIISIKKVKVGSPVIEFFLRHGMSDARFSGLDFSMVACSKALDAKTRRQKKMYVEVVVQTIMKK